MLQKFELTVGDMIFLTTLLGLEHISKYQISFICNFDVNYRNNEMRMLRLQYNHFQQITSIYILTNSQRKRMGNSNKILRTLYPSSQSDSLTGNYLIDHNFLKKKGYTLINAEKDNLLKATKSIVGHDMIYSKNRKLYAYRIIQGDYDELKTAIKHYNVLYSHNKNGIKNHSNSYSKIGSVQFINLTLCESDVKNLFNKILKINNYSNLTTKNIARLVLLLQFSPMTLDCLFKETIENSLVNTINNVQFLQVFGQLIQMASQFRSKGVPIKNINTSQVYIELNQYPQEQSKFSIKRLFYYPPIFHNPQSVDLSYYSPNQFQIESNIQQSSELDEENQYNLIFSMGMTLLSFLIKKTCKDCYNFNAKSFCRSILQENIDLLQKILLNYRQSRLQKMSLNSESSSRSMIYQNISGSFQHVLFSMISQMLVKRQYRTITTMSQVKKMYHQLTRTLCTSNMNSNKHYHKNIYENSIIENLKLQTQTNEQTTALTQSMVAKKKNIKKLKTVKRIMTQGKQNDGKKGNQQLVNEISIFKQFQSIRPYTIESSTLQFGKQLIKHLDLSCSNVSISMNWQDENGHVIQPIVSHKE